ncbi:hypothetical protein AVEN_159277-1 [Araneus ventricosus]|uniref:Uncharacterized protein n=1 Tax=Araneus ventricosus TaxID=182803 RepID=A0A4Y2A1Q7_ARAVE|nr:hypothetical protein AVEN_159277-1 [Araneus ventricosus]
MAYNYLLQAHYSRTLMKKVFVSQSRPIEQYNTKVGGVDLCDNLAANYSIGIRSYDIVATSENFLLAIAFHLSPCHGRQVELYSFMQDAKKVQLYCERTIGQRIYMSAFASSDRGREQHQLYAFTSVEYEPPLLDLQQYNRLCQPSRLGGAQAFRLV